MKWIVQDRRCGRQFPAEVESAEGGPLQLAVCPLCNVGPAVCDLIASAADAGARAGDSKDFEATTAAEELAKTEGIDLSAIQGNGAGGRIILEDVEKAVEERHAAAEANEDQEARQAAALLGLSLEQEAGEGTLVTKEDVKRRIAALVKSEPEEVPAS